MNEYDDHLEEECGVFGVWAPGSDVARLTFFGLQALQHRGQESAGIAVGDGEDVFCEKNVGLAKEVFDNLLLSSLQGKVAIGHVRYSTSDGASGYRAAQPHEALPGASTLALAHNGTLTNPKALLAELRTYERPEHKMTDSEMAARLLGHYLQETHSMMKAVQRLMRLMEGAYSMVALDRGRLFAFKDPHGVRPLCLGELPDDRGWVIASESCALDIIGAEYIREVMPGELVVIDTEGMHSFQVRKPERRASCIFEYVYFARPDSVIDSANVYRAREAMGRALFHEAPVEADIVIGVPDSGVPGAIGYARESGIVYTEGIVRNRYIDRTFIQPTQEMRQRGIRIKLNPLPYAVRNRRVVVVDDSIVRGNTSKQLVAMLREAGAKEVHLRIVSPPVVWPCFLGINTDTQDQLISARHSVDEVCKFVGADSLAYLSLEGLKSCIYAEHPGYCCACFDGRYPTKQPDCIHDETFLDGFEPTWED